MSGVRVALGSNGDPWLDHAFKTNDCARWVQRFTASAPHPTIGNAVPGFDGYDQIWMWMKKVYGEGRVWVGDW